jgi:hypothetical protein
MSYVYVYVYVYVYTSLITSYCNILRLETFVGSK